MKKTKRERVEKIAMNTDQERLESRIQYLEGRREELITENRQLKEQLAQTSIDPSQLQGEIWQEILIERTRQDEKWGVQRHTDEHWALILGEEMGEVCKSLIENPQSDELEMELIQVAAVVVAWLEQKGTHDHTEKI